MSGNGSKIVTDRHVRYHPLFDQDVIEAANWYDDRSAGLGDAFSANVLFSVSEIFSDPERFARTTAGLRYSRVERFPYVVLFDLAGTEILMLGVLHTARSMEKWRESRG
jgi:hypothetical protein